MITGATGFIGYHVAKSLLARGEKVVAVDNLNDYYDVRLKKKRLEQLSHSPCFHFLERDIVDRIAMEDVVRIHPDIDRIVHLAAQAGVRYSITNPHAYASTNLIGHFNLLELARHLKVKHFVYASSSSVYGANTKLPFSINDPTDTPISLYAATKKSNEIMSYSYSHLFNIPTTGLRFFTVYGPWGRPDMSAFIFAQAILNQKPMSVFNHGKMRRNYTYIDDIVDGAIAALDHVPAGEMIRHDEATKQQETSTPYRIYNLGNDQSESLMDFIHIMEEILGQRAIINFEDMQAGDVPETIADITESQKDLGFYPKIGVRDGLVQFLAWYKSIEGELR